MHACLQLFQFFFMEPVVASPVATYATRSAAAQFSRCIPTLSIPSSILVSTPSTSYLPVTSVRTALHHSSFTMSVQLTSAPTPSPRPSPLFSHFIFFIYSCAQNQLCAHPPSKFPVALSDISTSGSVFHLSISIYTSYPLFASRLFARRLLKCHSVQLNISPAIYSSDLSRLRVPFIKFPLS